MSISSWLRSYLCQFSMDFYPMRLILKLHSTVLNIRIYLNIGMPEWINGSYSNFSKLLIRCKLYPQVTSTSGAQAATHSNNWLRNGRSLLHFGAYLECSGFATICCAREDFWGESERERGPWGGNSIVSAQSSGSTLEPMIFGPFFVPKLGLTVNKKLCSFMLAWAHFWSDAS